MGYVGGSRAAGRASWELVDWGIPWWLAAAARGFVVGNQGEMGMTLRSDIRESAEERLGGGGRH